MLNMNELDKFIATKLHFYRRQMKWPLKKLADDLGVSLQQVQRYEQGLNKISASLLYQLAIIFNTDVNSFFEGFNAKGHDNIEAVNFKILLVEDNTHDEFLFRKALDDYPKKIDLYVVKDGQEAHLLFHDDIPAFFPDLIFMDIHLPHINGIDLLKMIKRSSLWKNIPVVIMTTSTSEEDVKDAYSLQTSGFIRKSFNFDEFKENIIQTIQYWTNTVKLPSKSS